MNSVCKQCGAKSPWIEPKEPAMVWQCSVCSARNTTDCSEYFTKSNAVTADDEMDLKDFDNEENPITYEY